MGNMRKWGDGNLLSHLRLLSLPFYLISCHHLNLQQNRTTVTFDAFTQLILFVKKI